MNHYVYELTFEDGMKYIGVHSCTLKPELDTCYLGSGRRLPERSPETCTKTILEVFSSREEATAKEKELIDTLGCVESENYYNVRNWNYDKHGQTSESHENIKITASKLKGRSADTHEYIAVATEKRKQYVGDKRTPAQLEADRKLRETTKGIPNPAKGHKGITNSGFKPWYYIDLTGKLTKVYDTPKQEYAHKLGLTPRQLGHRFHHTNINKPTKQGICKGWVFGNVEDLTDEE